MIREGGAARRAAGRRRRRRRRRGGGGGGRCMHRRADQSATLHPPVTHHRRLGHAQLLRELGHEFEEHLRPVAVPTALRAQHRGLHRSRCWFLVEFGSRCAAASDLRRQHVCTAGGLPMNPKIGCSSSSNCSFFATLGLPHAKTPHVQRWRVADRCQKVQAPATAWSGGGAAAPRRPRPWRAARHRRRLGVLEAMARVRRALGRQTPLPVSKFGPQNVVNPGQPFWASSATHRDASIVNSARLRHPEPPARVCVTRIHRSAEPPRFASPRPQRRIAPLAARLRSAGARLPRARPPPMQTAQRLGASSLTVQPFRPLPARSTRRLVVRAASKVRRIGRPVPCIPRLPHHTGAADRPPSHNNA